MEPINNNIKAVYKDGNNPYMPTMISIITKNHTARINIDDIELIEKDGRMVHIHTSDTDFQIYEDIKVLLDCVEGRSFYRVLKGLLINFDRVVNMDDSFIYFESGECIYMGKNNFGRTRTAYRKYLEEYPKYMYWSEHLKVAEKS